MESPSCDRFDPGGVGHGDRPPTTICESFQLDGWLVEPHLNRLCGHDRELTVEPRVMDVLCVLAIRAGEVVSRRELLDLVWRTEFVAENSLTHVIAELRSTLGDDARSPRFIQTIPKRGYRLIATVTAADTGAGPSLSAPRDGSAQPKPSDFGPLRTIGNYLALAAGAIIAILTGYLSWLSQSPPAAAPRRLVVLPFDTMGEPGDPSFAAGLTEEITARLASLHDIQVISRTTAVNYDRHGKTVVDIGTDLKVGYVLEGSVQWAVSDTGERRIRVTPQLIRATDDSHLWSAQYERTLDDFFTIQSEIGRQVVSKLGLELDRGEAAAMGGLPPTGLVAYQQYLLARGLLLSDDAKDLRAALTACQNALDSAPDFTLAWAHKAMAHALVVHFDCREDCSEQATAAREALCRATELDPGHPEVLRARGKVHYLVDGDFDSALAAFSRAVELRPNDSDSLAGRSFVLRRQGRWQESVSSLEQAVALDPLNASHLWNLGTSLMYLHRHAEADELFARAIAAAPGLRAPHFKRAWNYRIWDGSATRARSTLEAMPGPHDARWLWQMRAVLYFDRRFDEVLTLLDRPELDSTPGRRQYARCDALLMLGRADEAASACLAAVELLEQQRSDSSGPDLLDQLALAHANLGHGELARRLIDDAVAAVPASVNAPLLAQLAEERALILLRTGELDAAAEAVRDLLDQPSLLTPGVLANGPAWAGLKEVVGLPRPSEP